MMNKDGGAAFPACNEANVNGTMGMSLRDYFAAKAMPSVIDNCRSDTLMDGESRAQMFARKAYEIADAMLEARNVR